MCKIIEAKIEYKNNKLSKVTVQAEISQGDIRTMFADTKPINGYFFLKDSDILSDDLLLKIAGYGQTI